MHDVGGMHEVFAGETGDVWAGAAKPTALDDGASFVGLGRKCPVYVFACFSATEDEDVKVVWL